MITLRNVSKSYGSKDILQEIDLSFELGKVYGIAGSNGSGKTTLFKCIAGHESYLGHITPGAKKASQLLAFLPTEPFIMSHITGREYLQFVCNARKVGKVDLDDKNIFDLPLDDFATHYSTGMKKKLAITGILIPEYQYYILDEPFNGVDIQSNILIEQIILKMKESGKTVLISSHIFQTLESTCDEIFLLKENKVQTRATKKDFGKIESIMKADLTTDKLNKLKF